MVDITEYYDRKIGALCAHESQFGMNEKTDWKTLVNDPSFMRMIQTRDSYVGSLIQAAYGEGLYLEDKLAIDDVMSLKGRVRKWRIEKAEGEEQR